MTATLRRHFVWPLLIVCLLLQLGYSRQLAPLRPAIEEMPLPLSPTALNALALGDDEFLFRALALWLQDVGDGGGRVRPLRAYDYARVVGWLRALDGLNKTSDYAHEVAARYFGAISDRAGAPPRIGMIAEYFRDLAKENPGRWWHWLVWSGVKVQSVVKDPDLAARLADDLVALKGNNSVPDWLPLVAIRLYLLAGNDLAARTVENDPEMVEIRQRLADDFLKNAKNPRDNHSVR